MQEVRLADAIKFQSAAIRRVMVALRARYDGPIPAAHALDLQRVVALRNDDILARGQNLLAHGEVERNLASDYLLLSEHAGCGGTVLDLNLTMAEDCVSRIGTQLNMNA